MNKYNWDKIKGPSKLDDWKPFEENNPLIVLNVSYAREMKLFQFIFQNII